MFGRKKPKARRIVRLEELEELIGSGRPVLIDFYQVGCAPCQVMDGIVNELARDYGGSVHVVKVDVGRVPGAVDAFKVRSTPTFVLLGRPPEKRSKKAKKTDRRPSSKVTQRWRATGLLRKDQLARVLEANGARRAEA